MEHAEATTDRMRWTVGSPFIEDYIARQDALARSSPVRGRLWRWARPWTHIAFLVGEPIAMFGVPASLIGLAKGVVSGLVSSQAGWMTGYGLILLLAGMAAANWVRIYRRLRLRCIDLHWTLVTLGMTLAVPFAYWCMSTVCR